MTDQRLLRGTLLARQPQAISPLAPGLYKVCSQSSRGSYRVRLDGTNFFCDCPDFADRLRPCKHILGLVQHLALTVGIPVADMEPSEPRKSYPQDWPAYDAAQQAEHPLFDPLLWDLLTTVPDRVKLPGVPGRPPLSLRVALFQAVKKVHSLESARRARGLLLTTSGNGGILGHVPSYNAPSRLFLRPTTTPVLTGLIWLSAYPLRDLESGGTVSVDSTGFCTTCRGSYCTERYAPHRTHEWLKAHLSIGTKTHAVLSARITDERGADAPQFVPLLQEVKAAGFDPAEAVGDKAYLSRQNLEGAQALGMDPYIPFKVNSTPRAGGCRLWREKYHQFQLKRDEFEAHYHLRSNSEATHSAIKRKLGEALLSKDPQARINELLAKLLAYNIGVLVHEIFEHHIDPGVPGHASGPPSGPPDPTGIEGPVSELPALPVVTPVPTIQNAAPRP